MTSRSKSTCNFVLGTYLILLGLVLVISAPAQVTRQLEQEKPNLSDKRTALVIGNGDYQNARKLLNPFNDATDMAAALREVGFEVISG